MEKARSLLQSYGLQRDNQSVSADNSVLCLICRLSCFCFVLFPVERWGRLVKKTEARGAMCGEKMQLFGGRTNRSRYCGISSPFLFISSPVLSKSPLLLCVSSPRFLGASAACVSAPGKERRFEGVGCKLIRTSEEKKRKPRLETGSERGIEGEEIYLRGAILAIPRIPTHRYRLSWAEAELVSRCAGWVVRFCRRVHRWCAEREIQFCGSGHCKLPVVRV